MAVDFKTLTAKDRNNLPDSAFAFVDSDGTGHLPIHDAEHVRAAMARFNQTQFADSAVKASARRKILAAARRFGIDVTNFSADAAGRFGDPVTFEDMLGIAEFSIDFAGDVVEQTDDHLTLRGPLFRAGEYPDKKFSLSPEELYRVIRGFAARGKPAPMDLAHQPLEFAGADMTGWFGEIDRVWASDDSEWLMAEVTKPTWLHDVMPETKVSASFARDDKSLVGAAWTSTPRVEGAELIAAFADFAAPTSKGPGRPRHDTMHGQMAMQHGHDTMAAAGALCQLPSKADMASRHERSAIQEAHDIFVRHGAQCSSVDSTAGSVAMYSSEPDGSTPHPPSAGHTSSQRRNTLMSLLDWIKGAAEKDGVTITDAEIAAEFSKPALDRVDDLQAKLDEQAAAKQALEDELQVVRESAARHDAQFAASAAENRRLAAANFATEMVASHRVTPDAKAPLEALFARISESDAVATFAEGEQATADLLSEFIAKMPDLSLFSVEGMTAVLNPTTQTKGLGDDATEYTPEKREKYLSYSATGRAILAEEKKAAASNGQGGH